MNLGQHVADLIRISQQIQKLSADVKNPDKLYHLALEAKDAASKIQAVAREKMAHD